MANQPRYVLLTVLSGECSTPQQRFTLGSASPILSVGARAEWTIGGEGISDIHLLLAFDGGRVRAAAASEATRVEVDGKPDLGVEWRDLELPFELRFGSARLMGQLVGAASARAPAALPDFAAERRPDPSLAVAERRVLKTQLLDLSVLRPAALEAEAPPREETVRPSLGRDTVPFQVASGATLVWSLGSLEAKPPSAPPARPKPAEPEQPLPALDCTVCDGGALRDYARQLAASATEAAPAAKPEAPVSSPEPRQAARGRSLLSAVLRRLRALPVRRRLLAMPVLASLGVLPWLLGTPSAAQSSPAGKVMSSAAAPAAAAQPAELPAPAPPASESSAAAVTPPEAEPAAPAAPAPAEVAAASAEPEPSAAPARPTPSARSQRLEQDAFRAAFSGSTSEAAALYEELARLRGDPVFEQAARLARQNRVHKP